MGHPDKHLLGIYHQGVSGNLQSSQVVGNCQDLWKESTPLGYHDILMIYSLLIYLEDMMIRLLSNIEGEAVENGVILILKRNEIYC